MGSVLALLRRYATYICGEFSWKKPSWISPMFHYCRQHLIQTCSVILLFLLFGLGYVGLDYYRHLPKPELPTAVISPPDIAALSDEPENISPIFIHFVKAQGGYVAPEDFESLASSVAPINKINKDVTSGIHISPEMTGTWHWNNDHELQFIPTSAWPPGKAFTVSFEKGVFSAKTQLENNAYTFNTTSLEALVDDFKLYQNPLSPNKPEIVAKLVFNYPVDISTFPKQVWLIPQEINKQTLDLKAPRIPLKVNFSKQNRVAYVHSEPITLGSEAQFVVLGLDDTLKTSLGNAKLSSPVEQRLLLPDISNMLNIKSVNTSIVRNESNIPEQILAIDTSIGVSPADMQKNMTAYILPANYPATSTEPEKADYAWSSPEEVTPAILQQAKSISLMQIPEDRPYPSLNSYRYQAPGGSYLYVAIQPGLTGFGGYQLKNPYRVIMQVPEYPKEIQFLHNGALMALSSEHKLSLLVRGVSAVKFEVNRVLPHEINHLMSQTRGRYNDPYFLNYHFDKKDLSEVFSEVKTFNIEDPAKAQYAALDLENYLPKQNSNKALGLFIVNAKSWDIKQNKGTGISQDRLVLVTDMGLIVKTNKDNSHDVYVLSITSGKPVEQASIEILGRNGLPIAKAITDQQGHAHFATVEKFTDSQEPTVYIAKKGNDLSFIPFERRDRELNYSRYEVGGISEDEQNNSLMAYLFSDRGIYRPGDTVNLGMIVKQAYVATANSGIPLEAVITDPTNKVVLDTKVTTNEDGFLTLNYQTDGTSLTGDYTATLYIVKDGNRHKELGSTQFRLEEFLPDTLKIHSILNKDNEAGWVSPNDLSATVSLENLVGTPATHRKVTAKLVLSPRAFYFAQYSGYSFNDPYYEFNKNNSVIVDELPDEETDDQGRVQYHFHLERFEKAAYQLTFNVEGFAAESGRSVHAQNKILVSPLEYLLGFKTDGDFSFVTQNTQRFVNLIAVDKNLQKIELPNLTIELLRQKRISTLVQKEDGTYQYESALQELPISQSSVSIPTEGLDYPIPTQEIGQFILVLKAKDGVVLDRIPFSIVGNAQSDIQKNAELSIKLEKEQYKPGEDIHLQVTSPYSGNGLITIERDKVYASTWFTANTNTSLQTVHLPEDFVGDGYINVSFVRDWNSPEIFISPLSFSVAPFKTDRSNHDIQVDLQIPEDAKPGTLFPIQYRVDKPGKIIVYAVDEGILQVANYKTPDPLSYFFQKRALTVSTAQIVDQILPKYILNREVSAIGGDDSNAGAEFYLNPFKRKTELPVVFWSGILDADQQMQTINYAIPDYFNGRLRVMAVAVNQVSVGAAEKTAIISGDFVLLANMPTMLAPGDSFDLSVNVINNVKNAKELPIKVSVESSPGLTIMGDTIKMVTLSSKQEQVIHFTAKATEHLGNAVARFIATADKYESQVKATTSVRPATPFQVNLLLGHQNTGKNIIPLTMQFYPDYLQKNVIADQSPIIFMQGLQLYLTNYPYGCTEQVVSKGFGYFAFALLNREVANMKQKINETLTLLRQRQTSGGGYSYWPNAGDWGWSSRFSSVYALHFLTELHEKGFIAENEGLSAGMDYLRELVSHNPGSLEDARLQAYAIYLLTRNEIVTTGYLTNLHLYLENHHKEEWHKDIASSFMAATYKMLKMDKEADRLIGGYIIKSQPQNNNSFEASFFNQNNADAIYLGILAKHFPDRFKSLNEKILINLVDGMAQNQVDTTNAAYTMLALSSYQPNQADQIQINEKYLDNTSHSLAASKNYIPIPFSQKAVKLEFINPGKANYFYQIYQAGYPKQLPSKPMTEGLEINREYWDGEKELSNKVKQGDIITVHLKLRSLNDGYYTNIAVVDLLPAGFEWVPNSAQGNYDYIDVREDRVIFFTTAEPSINEITYQVKPTIKGKFIVPPIFAENMYNQRNMAQGVASQIEVE